MTELEPESNSEMDTFVTYGKPYNFQWNKTRNFIQTQFVNIAYQSRRQIDEKIGNEQLHYNSMQLC